MTQTVGIVFQSCLGIRSCFPIWCQNRGGPTPAAAW